MLTFSANVPGIDSKSSMYLMSKSNYLFAGQGMHENAFGCNQILNWLKSIKKIPEVPPI